MIDRRYLLLTGLALIASGNRGEAQAPGAPGAHESMSQGARSGFPGLAIPEGEPLRAMPRLANMASAPGAFAGTLRAAPASDVVQGRAKNVLAYNGLLPGPLIEAVEGDRVTIKFSNRIPGQESTIHWHGLPIPSDQDGNPMEPVQSGSDRTYSFTLPADSAGSFWYHPHPAKYTPEQVYRGLAGAFIVKPKHDPLPKELGDTPLFITDLRVTSDDTIPPNTDDDWANGREGDHVLVNGQKRPVVAVAPGSSRRFRLYNACNARYLRLAFEGHRMALIGTDGGLIGAPVSGLEEVLLSPGERAEVVVDFTSEAGRVRLVNLPYDRGRMGGRAPNAVPSPILGIELSGPPVKKVALPARLRDITRLGTPVTRKQLTFGERMAMGGSKMEFEGLIDGKSFELGRIDLISRADETELWEVSNPTDMDHPFHLHGAQFQVTEREQRGRVSPASIIAWKDTVNVARGETVRFLVRQDMPGLRVYHCHILEHEERGMMGTLRVQ